MQMLLQAFFIIIEFANLKLPPFLLVLFYIIVLIVVIGIAVAREWISGFYHVIDLSPVGQPTNVSVVNPYVSLELA